jgi:hypothetical protein
MANRDLLKEAIADAKAVKETAIANAKAALEESFTPYLREKLAAKLQEMDEDEVSEEVTEMKEKDLEETYDTTEAKEPDYMDEAEEVEEELDLEALLRELDELEEGSDEKMEERLGTINDPTGDYEHGNLAEAEEGEEEVEGEEEEEEIDLENMDEDDLKKFIEDVIADMVASGELEGNMEGEEEGEEEMEMDMEMPMAEEKEMDEAKDMEMEAMKKELEEAYAALESVKAELNEINLLNAKLLYTNKIFKAKNLTESQKVKVLTAFDKATSVKEAKLVYETLSTSAIVSPKKPMNESLIRGAASKPTGVSEKKPIMEADTQVARWQKLAGIIK